MREGVTSRSVRNGHVGEKETDETKRRKRNGGRRRDDEKAASKAVWDIYICIYIYELNSQELHISTELFYVRSSINSEQVSTFILLRFQQAEGFRFEYHVSINNIQLFFVKIKLLHNFICYHFFSFQLSNFHKIFFDNLVQMSNGKRVSTFLDVQ